MNEQILAHIEGFLKFDADPEENDLFTTLGKLFEIQAGGKTAEIGNGIVRILEHKQTGRCRIVMRKNKTYEVLLNHYLLPSLQLSSPPGKNTMQVWNATDYSTQAAKARKIVLNIPLNDHIAGFQGAFRAAQEKNAAILN